MKLDDLHLAVVVAREGSLAAASNTLGVSQPTLSKAIARLERATRARLFMRVARGMRPTELGQAFLERARGIDQAAADLYAAMRDLRQARAGVLRFGVGAGIPNRWVLALTTALADAGVRLDLSSGMADAMQRGVANGEIEFALVGLSGAPGGVLAWEPLRDDPTGPLVPVRHRLAATARPVGWTELAQARWIVPPPGMAAHDEFLRNFAARGQAPVPWVVSRSSERELALARAVGAVVLIPQSVREEPALARAFATVRPQGGWHSARRVALVARAGGYLSPAAERAMSLLRDLVRH